MGYYGLDPARKLYEERLHYRRPFVDRAIACSERTDRSLFRWDGSNETESIEEAYQATGAAGLDFMTSSLLLAMFPPNIEVVRLEMDPVVAKKMSGNPKYKDRADKALSMYSEKIADEVDAIELRGPMAKAIRHILVAGNCLFYLPERGPCRMIPLTNYVQERDPYGRISLIVILESIPERSLTPAMRSIQDQVKGPTGSSGRREEGIMVSPGEPAQVRYRLYTVICADPPKDDYSPLTYRLWQELEDVEVPKSFSKRYDEYSMPFMSFGYEWVAGEHYSRSRVERYAGHLNSLEGLTQIILEGAAASSKVIFTVDPGGVTDPDDMADANNCDIIRGRPSDVGAIQSGKTQDLAFAGSLAERMDIQLQKNFGLAFIPRSGERVPLGESQISSEQIDRGMGGLYSHFSNNIQRPTFYRIMGRIESRGEAPMVPMRAFKKQVLRPRIITGLEALGRGNDAARMRQAVDDLATLGTVKPEILQTLDLGAITTKIFLGRGVNPEEVTLSDEEIAQKQEAAQRQALALAAAPNMVTQGGQMIQNAQGQPQ